MKKSALILAACGMAATGAQAQQGNVTVYGVIDMSMVSTSKAAPGNNSRFSLDSGDQMASRIGFKGKEELGGGLAAIFQLETGFGADDGAMATPGTLFDRKSVVGLSGRFGTLTLGRQTDYLEDIGTRYTSFQIFGGGGVRAGHFNGLDRITGARTSHSLRFDSASDGGFSGSLFYGVGEVAGNNSAGRAMGMGANYANGPFGIGAAYYQSKLAADAAPARAGDTDLKTFTLGASYQAGPAKIFGAWSRTRRPLQQPLAASGLVNLTSATRANIFDLGVDYAVNGSLHLIGSVIHDRADLARTGDGATRARTTQFNLGVDYFLSKRTDVYAIASRQQASDAINPGVIGAAYAVAPTDDSSQNVLRLGLRHKF
ncbi:MAG: Outer membrane porin protein 32 [Herbaspirillum frisingense]|uniref:Outer membrane porin protein 32 n=1 Tax=Herbaspirillum frisingense TaxID=92645 RepID=A0A7V8FVP2_9BURK|nr:MAG: Outer membrane porin protein 32 [Herbaspirillum frisingense]